MNKVHILLAACLALSSAVMATLIEDPETSIDQADTDDADETEDTEDQPGQADQKNSDPDLVKAVEEALKVIAKGSPQISEDSLRVWKNFKATSKPVHYTYRSWGRQIIMWLKSEKKMAFYSEAQVGEVFKILWRKGLISRNAVVVLMADVWSYLVYLEGSPSWEKRPDTQRPQRGMTPASPSGRQKSNERST